MGCEDSSKAVSVPSSERTISLMKNHRPEPLPEDLIGELAGIEKTWFDRVGLKHEYPQGAV